jgi:hypothetical protein
MNWRQLHTAATPEERLELMLHLLETIERRQRRLVRVGWGFRRERRRQRAAHFIGDRRLRHRSPLLRALWLYTLATLSIATWLIAAHIQPIYGAPLLFGYNLLLLAILLIKPYRRQPQSI